MSVSISPSDFGGEKSAFLSMPPSWVDYLTKVFVGKDVEKEFKFEPSELETLYRKTLRTMLYIEDIPSELELSLDYLDPIFEILVGMTISNFHTSGKIAVRDYHNSSGRYYPPVDPQRVSKFNFRHLFSMPVEHEDRALRLLKILLPMHYSYIFEKSERLSFKNSKVNLESYNLASGINIVTNQHGSKVTLVEYVREFLESRGAEITSDLQCDVVVVDLDHLTDRNALMGGRLGLEDVYFNIGRVNSDTFHRMYESDTSLRLINGIKGYYLNEDIKGRLISRLREGVLPIFKKMVDQGIFLPDDTKEIQVLSGIVSQFDCYIRGLESTDKLLIPARYFDALCHVYAPMFGIEFGAELFNSCFTPLDSSRIYFACPITYKDTFILEPNNIIKATNQDVIRLTPEVLIQKARQYYQNQAVKQEKNIDKLDIDQNDKEVLENIFASLQSTDSETLIFTFSLLEKLTFSFDTAVSVGSLLVSNPRCTLVPDTYIVHNVVPEIILSKFKPYKIRIKTTNKETFIKSVLKADPNMIHTNVYFRRCIIDHFVPTYS